MSHRLIILSFLLILPMSCTQFQTGRTYLTEMEHDDSRFFNPSEDFPIMAGDSGRTWNTEEEQRARTPASKEEYSQDRIARLLRQELRELEGIQSERSLKFYDEHKHQLRTVSEKIYFLKLPPYERRDYLIGRGFIAEPKGQLATANERMFAIEKQDIMMGMTKDDVLGSWGKPLQVEVAGNPRNENERWLYRMNGASKYIYFESGEVQGWE